MNLFRTSKLKRNETMTSQMKFYEGVVYYDIAKDEHLISIMPLNVVLRLIRKFYLWLRFAL